jgi:glutaminyl-peptide cyclotransferase
MIPDMSNAQYITRHAMKCWIARSFALFACAVLLIGQHPPLAQAQTPVYSYSVVASYPHDPDAFTQGLVYENGQLYEGTGLNGRSSVRRVDLATGEVLQRFDLPQAYFGEGIAVVG